MTPFRFTLQKKIQAASVILAGRGHMDKLRLLKVLYIADRESLAERGCPIIGGRMVAMNHGPLHSEIYDLIKGSYFKSGEWSKHIASGPGHTLVLIDEPDRMDLSPYEIDKLNEVTERYAQMDTWDLSQLTHSFQEWIDNFHANTSTSIPAEDAMKAVGFTDEDIAHVMRDAASHSMLLQKMA